MDEDDFDWLEVLMNSVPSPDVDTTINPPVEFDDDIFRSATTETANIDAICKEEASKNGHLRIASSSNPDATGHSSSSPNVSQFADDVIGNSVGYGLHSSIASTVREMSGSQTLQQEVFQPHQQQGFGTSNVPGVQHSDVLNLQSDQHSRHILQPAEAAVVQNDVQQTSQPIQLNVSQINSSQEAMQQRLQTSAALPKPKTVIDQQQLLQSQRVLPEASADATGHSSSSQNVSQFADDVIGNSVGYGLQPSIASRKRKMYERDSPRQENMTNTFQQPLSSLSNVPGVQHPERTVAPQSNVLNLQPHQHSRRILQPTEVTAVQRTSQLIQLHQLHGSQVNLSQEAIQQRHQTSAALPKPKNVTDQQQLLQSQRVLPEASAASVRFSAPTELTNTGNLYDELQSVREKCLPDLESFHKALTDRLQLLQSVREKGLPDLEILHKKFSDNIQLAQKPEQFKKKLTVIGNMIKLLNLTRSDIVNIPKKILWKYLQEIVQYHKKINSSLEAMQQRLQTSAALLQPMNVIDRRQLHQSQRVLPTDATGHCSSSQNVSGSQILHQLLNQKVQQPNISPSLVQSNIHSQKRPRNLSQPIQLHQLRGSQINLSQEAMQWPQTSAALLQPKNVVDQQHLLQSQRVLPTASARASAPTEFTNRTDWHDQTYQQFQSVREKCLPHLEKLHETFSEKHHLAKMPEQFKDELVMIGRMIKLLKLTPSDMVHYPEMILRQKIKEIDQYHSNITWLVRNHLAAASIEQGLINVSARGLQKTGTQ